MNPCLNYPDSAIFVETELGDYGDDESVLSRTTVPAIIVQATAYNHGDNQNAIASDTTLYIDPENSFVKANYYRMEELLVVLNTFGSQGEEYQNWYKVIGVNVSKDHLLCNNIDNVEVLLKKTAGMV